MPNPLARTRLAMQRLLSRYPLLGGIAAGMQVSADPAVRTMSVGMKDEQLHLYVNTEYVEPLSLEKILGVLHHELRHVLFGHVFYDHNDYPDNNALRIATEVTVNENLNEPLPGDPPRLEDYPQLAPLQSTHERYNILTPPPPESPPEPSPEESQPDDSSSESQKDSDGSQPGDSDDDQSGQDSEPANSNHESSLSPEQFTTGREHWHELQQQQDAVRIQIQAQLPAAMKQAQSQNKLDDQTIELYGSLTAGETKVRQLLDKTSTKTDWRNLLRRFVASAAQPGPNLMRPSRRHPELIGLVPGKSNQPKRLAIMAAIDTSASMTDELLAQIAAEVDRLAKDHDVHIVECDTEVRNVYRYNKNFNHPSGGGGTDLRPPFEPALLKQLRPDVVAYFTDGYGPAPQSPPPAKVLWVLTPQGQKPASWGDEAHMVPGAASGLP